MCVYICVRCILCCVVILSSAVSLIFLFVNVYSMCISLSLSLHDLIERSECDGGRPGPAGGAEALAGDVGITTAGAIFIYLLGIYCE